MNLPKSFRKKIIEGLSLPGIICNHTYHFTTLEVYEDGRVNCWHLEDFEHFKKDVQRGWVAVSIPDGGNFSVFNLGAWVIEGGQWTHSKDTFVDYVWSVVQRLNPALHNLHVYQEKKVNGVGILESGNGTAFKEQHRVPNDPFPKRIEGKTLHLFWKNEQEEYHLVRLDMYDPTSIFIQYLDTPLEQTLVQLETLFANKTLVTQVTQINRRWS